MEKTGHVYTNVKLADIKLESHSTYTAVLNIVKLQGSTFLVIVICKCGHTHTRKVDSVLMFHIRQVGFAHNGPIILTIALLQ